MIAAFVLIIDVLPESCPRTVTTHSPESAFHEESPTTRYICVAGMHRSGTSLVARVVNLLGVDFGPEDDLMGSKEDNPTGFWENLAISSFNNDLLAELGGRWDQPPALEEGWETEERMESWRKRAAAIVQTRFTQPVAGWKDPRMSFLLPFWQTVVPIDTTVFSIRDPRAVWASLQRRDGTDEDGAGYLWLRYVVSGLRASPGALVVKYQEFFEDLPEVIDRMAAHLDLLPPSDETMFEINRFFDPELRHHTPTTQPSSPNMTLAVEVFRCLEEGSIPAILDSLQDGWLFQQRLDRAETQIHQARAAAEAQIQQTQEEAEAQIQQTQEEAESRVAEAVRRLKIKDRTLLRYEIQEAQIGRQARTLSEKNLKLSEALTAAEQQIEEMSRGLAHRLRLKMRGG